MNAIFQTFEPDLSSGQAGLLSPAPVAQKPVAQRSSPAIARTSGSMTERDNQSSIAEQMAAHIRKVADHRDRAAFAEVFDYFGPRLKSYVMRQGSDPQLAEEVVQETMVKIWHKADQFDSKKASASTWIYTIARNMRIDLLRKMNRPEPDMNDPAMTPDPDPMAYDKIAFDQEADQLKKSITLLPEDQQRVLQLAYFEDKTHNDVAVELNVPLGTVKSRIRLALKRIRTELGDLR
ncbi:sigma-70 family RNA polymerase sigma factor [Rhodospirillales bacterium]|nr:sigma-70 family RNA polymerase sigma factor [Rhodospirillales bacterium]